MMTVVWIVLGVLVLGFLLLWLNAIRASAKRDVELDEMVQPALTAVAGNSASANDLISGLASRPAARNHLYSKLKEIGKSDLFPTEYRTAEKVAESDLTTWLMHPNELAAEPAQIELVRRIEVQEGSKLGTTFLFRFRAAAGHWAADRGWMAGSTGPYWNGEVEVGANAHAFSELVSFDKMSEEQHVEFLKDAMNKKGLVVPS